MPVANASLIVTTESVGWAMKNLLIGIDVPGVGPLAHVVPDHHMTGHFPRRHGNSAQFGRTTPEPATCHTPRQHRKTMT